MAADSKIAWQYDEFHQVGVDYGRKDVVEEYDSRHSGFRDIEKEGNRVLDAIGIQNSDVLIDIGSGTGSFAILAAKRCRKVYAIDVSGAMIEYAKSKVKRNGVSNIEFHQAGFLNYEHTGAPADCLVTTLAFHHLPDLWKGIALKRMNSMLRPAGILYMHDVIVEEHNACDNIKAFIHMISMKSGNSMREGAERHFKEEFSTYDWVMDGLITRSGFSILKKDIAGGVLGTYVCVKN